MDGLILISTVYFCIYVYGMPLSVCRYVRVCVGTCGDQKRVSLPLEMELEVVVNSLMY